MEVAQLVGEKTRVLSLQTLTFPNPGPYSTPLRSQFCLVSRPTMQKDRRAITASSNTLQTGAEPAANTPTNMQLLPGA
jgi:hypothetical protein